MTALSANGHGFSDDTPPYSRTHSRTYPLTLTHSRSHALVLSLTHSRPHSTICSQRRRTSAYTYRSILPSRTLAHSPRPLEALQPEAYSTFHSPVCLLTARLLHRVRPALHIKSVVQIYRDGHCGERFPLLSCLLTHPYRLKHCSHGLKQVPQPPLPAHRSIAAPYSARSAYRISCTNIGRGPCGNGSLTHIKRIPCFTPPAWCIVAGASSISPSPVCKWAAQVLRPVHQPSLFDPFYKYRPRTLRDH